MNALRRRWSCPWPGASAAFRPDSGDAGPQCGIVSGGSPAVNAARPRPARALALRPPGDGVGAEDLGALARRRAPPLTITRTRRYSISLLSVGVQSVRAAPILIFRSLN